MDLLNSPRFTDRTSGISNNRFIVGPAPLWRSTIRSTKKSASAEMDSDWILESIWGLLLGAVSAMMVMADAYGADARLVAFMQYVRVVMVAIVASIIARLWVHAPAVASAAPAVWFAPIHALPFFETL